jgi:hypothetical protein
MDNARKEPNTINRQSVAGRVFGIWVWRGNLNSQTRNLGTLLELGPLGSSEATKPVKA